METPRLGKPTTVGSLLSCVCGTKSQSYAETDNSH